VQGYALDALEGVDGDVPSIDAARTFVDDVAASPTLERDGIGLGRDVRVNASRLTGAGLVCAGELVQLSVFTVAGSRLDSSRIRRPSRRHH
jgi:hypothetical protein